MPLRLLPLKLTGGYTQRKHTTPETVDGVVLRLVEVEEGGVDPVEPLHVLTAAGPVSWADTWIILVLWLPSLYLQELHSWISLSFFCFYPVFTTNLDGQNILQSFFFFSKELFEMFNHLWQYDTCHYLGFHMLCWFVSRVTWKITEWSSTKLWWRVSFSPEQTPLTSHRFRMKYSWICRQKKTKKQSIWFAVMMQKYKRVDW